MKVNELLQKLLDAVKAGYGNAEVVYDTEAKHYTCHLVKVHHATYENYGDDDGAAEKHFILTDNHPHSEEDEYWYYKPLYESRETERLTARVLLDAMSNGFPDVEGLKENYTQTKKVVDSFESQLLKEGYKLGNKG